LNTCHKAGQAKASTPLMLHYEAEVSTVCIRISMATSVFRCKWYSACQQRRDWEGGELVLVAKPRGIQAQWLSPMRTSDHFHDARSPSKARACYYQRQLVIGVSRVHRGTRYTLGVSFSHDAK